MPRSKYLSKPLSWWLQTPLYAVRFLRWKAATLREAATLKRFNQASRVPVRLQNGSQFEMEATGSIALTLFGHGDYEPEETQQFLQLLQPGAVIVDAGANAGYFALSAAISQPTAQIVAIEPCAGTFDILQRNIEINNAHNITPVQCALSDYEGEADLFLNETNRDGLNALSRSFYSDAVPVGTERVSVKTLDAVLQQQGVKRVDILKIDVEGGELALLRGATQLLDGPSAPTIIYEAQPEAAEANGYTIEDVSALLRAHGYSIRRLENDMTAIATKA